MGRSRKALKERMQRADESRQAADAAAPWTRGALVSLWLVAFALAAFALAARWDALVAGLASAPRGAQEASRQ